MYHLKMVQVSETTASKMCVECGCESVGSSTGIADATINDVSNDGESGLTLNMSATPQERQRFINGQ